MKNTFQFSILAIAALTAATLAIATPASAALHPNALTSNGIAANGATKTVVSHGGPGTSATVVIHAVTLADGRRLPVK